MLNVSLLTMAGKDEEDDGPHGSEYKKLKSDDVFYISDFFQSRGLSERVNKETSELETLGVLLMHE